MTPLYDGLDNRPPLLYATEGDGRRVLTVDLEAMKPGDSVAFERTDPEAEQDGRYATVTVVVKRADEA